ncbi:MAG: nickel-dependent hydrogenase large subunit [Candidatus Contendobacter sp.]|nr:nickel-dependent hydrogenase large subunit [Candidatus Contendobacter sp.]
MATPQRLVVDPITRIEGHLRIEAEMNGNTVTKAYSSSVMMRGIELILKGRDPREAWALAQRFCGVCTLVHGIASVRTVEKALNYSIPPNAQLIRNLMIAAQFIHDHVMHFYHLHALDWVDIPAAINADPAKTASLQKSLSGWPNNSTAYFAGVQTKLKSFVAGGQLGIFANAYWGHPAYKLPPEVNLLAFAHYLEALSWQREVAKLHAVFGGKNPHPNFLVGGVPCAISVDNRLANYAGGRTAVNAAGLTLVSSVIQKMQNFVNQVYLPDTLAIAGFYKEWAAPQFGEKIGNFLVYGDFPDETGSNCKLPGGVILNRDLSKVLPVNLEAASEIQESVAHSWYDYSAGKNTPLHPYQGETTPNYQGTGGPAPPYDYLNVEQSYSWIKAPRWNGKAAEVGPLARVLVLYAKGDPATKALVDSSLSKLGLTQANLFSTMGRVLARTLETKVIADWMPAWNAKLRDNISHGDFNTFNDLKWDPKTWPATAQGAGFTEAPRGALAHWIKIKNGLIENYQAVVPSTWNASPRDAKGQPGAYEQALVGHTLAVADQPLELLRTIHSFDPCIGCAVHLVDADGKDLLQIDLAA